VKKLLLVLLLIIAGCGNSDVAPVAPSQGVDGRARLVNLAPAAVPPIDSLGPASALVYADIAAFNDNNPSLTGTVNQAITGLALSVQTFGASRLAELLRSVLPDTGQSLCSSLAGNFEPATPAGAERCRDAMAVVGAPQQSGGRNPEVQSGLSPDLSTMPKFHSLRLLWPGAVPSQQRSILKQLRDSLTYPTAGTPLQKVLKVADMNNYLNGTFDPRVSGFQAVVNDVASLATPAEIIEGLRLDYVGGFQNETQVAILQYRQLPSFSLLIPYSPANGGNRTDAYPFAGNGFTATVKANAIPEWVLPSGGVPLQTGDTMTLVQADGTHILQATFQSGHWVSPGGQVLTRRLGREMINARVEYQGMTLFVTSQDEQFRHVLSDQPLPPALVSDVVQVGAGEWRGKIPLD
jgi:hypothetical protein